MSQPIYRKDNLRYLGQFEQTSNSMIISDPTFEDSGDSLFGETFYLENVLPGLYDSWVVKSELIYQNYSRLDNTYLLAIHYQYVTQTFDWKKITKVPVDTGQAGIYDSEYYCADDEKWYDMNSQIILTDLGAGVLPHGVVSHSGPGDGVYTAYAAYVNEKVIAVCINFEDDDDNTDDDTDEDDDN